jgi:hypothetical protein
MTKVTDRFDSSGVTVCVLKPLIEQYKFMVRLYVIGLPAWKC